MAIAGAQQVCCSASCANVRPADDWILRRWSGQNLGVLFTEASSQQTAKTRYGRASRVRTLVREPFPGLSEASGTDSEDESVNPAPLSSSRHVQDATSSWGDLVSNVSRVAGGVTARAREGSGKGDEKDPERVEKDREDVAVGKSVGVPRECRCSASVPLHPLPWASDKRQFLVRSRSLQVCGLRFSYKLY